MQKLNIFQAKLETKNSSTGNKELKIGYGRDAAEAASNAAFDYPPNPDEVFTEITIFNFDNGLSRFVANKICNFHIFEDDIPTRIKSKLKFLIDSGLYAEAVYLCFETVWDKNFEN